MDRRRCCPVCGSSLGLHSPCSGGRASRRSGAYVEATPEWAPAFPPRNLPVVDRTETYLSVVSNSITRAIHYDVQRSDSEDGEYAFVATEVVALGLVDEGLQPDSVYYYLVRACNHLGCTEFSDDPVIGLTESDADVSIPASPNDVQVVETRFRSSMTLTR